MFTFIELFAKSWFVDLLPHPIILLIVPLLKMTAPWVVELRVFWVHIVLAVVERGTHKGCVFFLSTWAFLSIMQVLLWVTWLLLDVMYGGARFIHNYKAISSISIIAIILVIVIFSVRWLLPDCCVKRFVFFSLGLQSLIIFLRRMQNILIERSHQRQLLLIISTLFLRLFVFAWTFL